jgi:segregation and condensation protein B
MSNLKELKKLVEAALFMSPSAMDIETLSKSCNRSISETRLSLNELIQEYRERETALEIRDEPTGFRMAVKPSLEDRVSHLAAAPEMHKGIMKTLAYIAYKQPLKQTQVIKFRNNKAYEHIKVLLEKGFIRKEPEGNSYIIYTTKKFYEYFGKTKSEKSVKKEEYAGSFSEKN